MPDKFTDPYFFWKNFRLGTELQLTGSFIYNGIYEFDNMKHFYYEQQCFEVLYNLAVGFERLMKIAIVLTEHNEGEDQELFEKSLITHNHLELFNRLKKNHDIKHGRVHTKLLGILLEFYKSIRYNRFNLSSVYHTSLDRKRMIDFFEEGLNISISVDMLSCTAIDWRMKRYLGRTIKKLTDQVYTIIRNQSYKNMTFTYEISYDTKAYKIFMIKTFDFFNERMLQKELILYLLRRNYNADMKDFIESVEVLPFEEYDFNEYVAAVTSIHGSTTVLGEFEELAESVNYGKSRIDFLNFFGSDSPIESMHEPLWFEEE